MTPHSGQQALETAPLVVSHKWIPGVCNTDGAGHVFTFLLRFKISAKRGQPVRSPQDGKPTVWERVGVHQLPELGSARLVSGFKGEFKGRYNIRLKRTCAREALPLRLGVPGGPGEGGPHSRPAQSKLRLRLCPSDGPA